jgi:hypothetical protein
MALNPDGGSRTPLLREQLRIAWSLTELVLEGLTDDECHRLPAPDAWTVRRGPDGSWHADWVDPEPEPPPAATIAWLTWHLDMWWSMVHDHSFGAGTLRPDQVRWTGAAATAVARIRHRYKQWSAVLTQLTDADLDVAHRTRWPYRDGRAFGHVVARVNLELMKNAAEIGQLRRIYRVADR